ncbi:MAG: pyridoxamine 5'-phosphate oxidase family protein [Deltaproteobacteria bacterium]|nr:pyridoxamine 5'-phosphate oxidase family protein [Deltaproteobacteria bacterium]
METSTMAELAPTPRTRVKRLPQRGSYDREVLNAILDEGFLCHVAFLYEGQARVIPTIYARGGDFLYLHGARANRMLNAMIEPGHDACLSVTHVDALVLARSAFHHSVNYRSAVVYGQAEEVTDPDEKREALRLLVEQVMAGRSKDVRGPNAAELKQTLVVKLPIAEASAKIRAHGVVDDEADMGLGCWAGLLPIQTRYGPPVRDPALAEEIPLPGYLDGYSRAPR